MNLLFIIKVVLTIPPVIGIMLGIYGLAELFFNNAESTIEDINREFLFIAIGFIGSILVFWIWSSEAPILLGGIINLWVEDE